jgi:hypothetical protein
VVREYCDIKEEGKHGSHTHTHSYQKMGSTMDGEMTHKRGLNQWAKIKS